MAAHGFSIEQMVGLVQREIDGRAALSELGSGDA